MPIKYFFQKKIPLILAFKLNLCDFDSRNDEKEEFIELLFFIEKF